MIRFVLAWVLAAISGLLVLLGALVKKAGEVAVENEYDTWAPKLARLLTQMAGFACPGRRDRWWADLCFIQKIERRTGLVEATACFMSCWFLAVCDAVQVVRSGEANWHGISRASLFSNLLGAGASAASLGWQLSGRYLWGTLAVFLLGGFVVSSMILRRVERRYLDRLQGLDGPPEPGHTS